MYFCSMKFVYPFKYKYNYFGVEQSIRWLYMAFPDAEVYVIGDAPKIDLPFVHIPYQSSLAYAGCDVTDKILTFCNLIGDEFVVMNDDFFITEKFPLHKVMKYDQLNINPSHCITYQRAVENTIDWLLDNHLEIVNYECHQPVYVQSCKFIELFTYIDHTKHNHLWKSLYFNTWSVRTYEGANLKLGYSLTKAKEYLETYGAFSCASSFYTSENSSFISKYSNSVESLPSVVCQLCHSPAPPLE